MNPFLDAVLILGDYHANVYCSRTEVLYPCGMEWKAAIFRRMLQPMMLEGKDAVKKVCRYGEKKLYQGSGDVHFMQKKTEFMGAGYAIMECIADPTRHLKKLLDRNELSGKYERMSLHVLIDWVHFTIPAK